MRYRPALTVLFFFTCIALKAQAQDTISLRQLPAKYIDAVSTKSASLEKNLKKHLYNNRKKVMYPETAVVY